jgi:hypothetical protein
MTALIHFFALADTYSTWLFCGDFREGDGWTALPHGVTCPECKRRVDAFTESRRAGLVSPPEPAPAH